MASVDATVPPANNRQCERSPASRKDDVVIAEREVATFDATTDRFDRGRDFLDPVLSVRRDLQTGGELP